MLGLQGSCGEQGLKEYGVKYVGILGSEDLKARESKASSLLRVYNITMYVQGFGTFYNY